MMSDSIEACKLMLKAYMDRMYIASQSYDKALLGLSTATLGFTFAFIRVANVCEPLACMCVLYLTWIFLIASIVFILLSFIADQLHSSHEIDYYLSRITGKTKNNDKEAHWATGPMIYLPFFSGLFFVVAIILFTVFVGKNV